MLKSISIITGAVLLAIILVKNVLPEPSFHNPLDKIEFGKKLARPYLAWQGYKELIKKDSMNIRYHYGVLTTEQQVMGLKEENDAFQADRNVSTRDYYYGLCLKDSKKENDIGNFGLAIKATYSNDYTDANKHLDLIHDTVLPMLNYVRAQIALNNNDWPEAERYLKREIELKGDTDEAYYALGLLYLKENRMKNFAALADNTSSRQYMPKPQLREYYFNNAKVFLYMALVLSAVYGGSKTLMVIAAFLLVLLWINYLRRVTLKHEKWQNMAIIFVLGMMFTMIVYPIDDAWRTLSHVSFTVSFDHNFWYCLIGIGAVEEMIKIIPFFIVLRFFKFIKEPIDYIVFASISALGFSFAENIIYFKTASLGTILLRGLLSTTLHMTLTSMLAYSLILGRFRKNVNTYLAFAVAFAFASFVHGLYDYSIFTDAGGIALIFIGIPVVFMWGIMLNTAINQSSLATDESVIDNVKTTTYLHYAFTGVLLFVFLGEGLMYGPKITMINTPGATLLCIPMLLFITASLSNFEVIPGYWVPISFRGINLLPGWYDINGLRLVVKSFRVGSILEDIPLITGYVVHDMKIEGERWHLLKLETPIKMDGNIYTHGVIRAKEEAEPVGLTADVLSYFMIVPGDVDTEDKEFNKRDFEFIDWAMISPMKTYAVNAAPLEIT